MTYTRSTILCLVAICSVANAALPASALWPAPGAKDVCADAALRIAMPDGAKLGSSGKIRVFDATTDTEVASVDFASPIGTQKIGGVGDFKYRGVLANDKQVSIVLPSRALGYCNTYYVKMDPGVIADSEGINDSKFWRFSTKLVAPTPTNGKLIVAADGSGDFCTFQGAIDSLPAGNTTPVTIFIRKGTYTEIVCFTNKNNITLLGEDRKQTVIAYTNNEAFNRISGNPFGGDHPDPASFDPAKGEPVYHRGVFIGHRVNDLTIANLTLRNTTPRGGGQAETIILNGTTSAHAILKDVDLFSAQDTLQINGQAYLENCYIEGDVDFMWGTGPCFFENCHLRSTRSGTYYTQIRNQPTNHGFVYHRCLFDGTDGVTNMFLSRIASGKYFASEVVLIDCSLTSAVGKAAWQLQGPPNDVHFWEFNSHDPDGKPIDTSGRLPASKQLKQPDDAAAIDNFANPKFVLGSEWDPKQAAIFKQ